VIYEFARNSQNSNFLRLSRQTMCWQTLDIACGTVTMRTRHFCYLLQQSNVVAIWTFDKNPYCVLCASVSTVMPAEINQQIIRYRCEICAQHAHSLSTFRRRRPSGDHRRSESRKRTSSVCAVSVISDVANAASAADSKATPPAQMKNTRRAAAAAGHKTTKRHRRPQYIGPQL